MIWDFTNLVHISVAFAQNRVPDFLTKTEPSTVVKLFHQSWKHMQCTCGYVESYVDLYSLVTNNTHEFTVSSQQELVEENIYDSYRMYMALPDRCISEYPMTVYSNSRRTRALRPHIVSACSFRSLTAVDYFRSLIVWATWTSCLIACWGDIRKTLRTKCKCYMTIERWLDNFIFWF